MLSAATGGGARVDGGGGMTFQRSGALMTAKNARTEARGFLMQFAGGTPEFQREIVLIHGGKYSVSTRDKIGIGPRRGQENFPTGAPSQAHDPMIQCDMDIGFIFVPFCFFDGGFNGIDEKQRRKKNTNW